MQLKDVMTQDVQVVNPDTTLREAAEKMRKHDIGPLPVCQNNRLVGMLTDRDLAVRAVAEGRDPSTTKVSDVMTEEVVCIFEDQDVQDAADLMAERQVRRLVVLNRDKQVAGIVSLGDLALDTEDAEMTGRTLERVSEPSEPDVLDSEIDDAQRQRTELPTPTGGLPGQRIAPREPSTEAATPSAKPAAEDPLLARAAADQPKTSHIFRLYKASYLTDCGVRNREGDHLGELEELVVDVEQGRIAYAVLSFGGVLGMGGKLFAIPWDALVLKPDDKVFILNVAKEKLESAPGFDKDNWPDMADRRWGSGIHDYYGHPPYWTKTL